MNWYKGLCIMLGVTALQAMENDPVEQKLPKSRQERLVEAINKADLQEVKWHLWDMKDISKEQKAELLAIAQKALKERQENVSLEKSPVDKRNFFWFLGAASVTGAIGYVLYKSCMKKSTCFTEAQQLEDEKKLNQAKEMVTLLAEGKRIKLGEEKIKEFAQKAVDKGLLDSSKAIAKNYNRDVQNCYQAAYVKWHNSKADKYYEEKKKVEARFLDFTGTLIAECGIASLCLRLCQKAYGAYCCPTARGLIVNAREIKERIELLEAS